MAKKVPSLNEANSPSGDPPNNPAKKSETEYVGLSENTCLYLVMEYRTAGANRDAWELNVCRVIDFSLSDVKQAHAELMSVIGNRFPDVYNDSDFKKKVIGNRVAYVPEFSGTAQHIYMCRHIIFKKIHQHSTAHMFFYIDVPAHTSTQNYDFQFVFCIENFAIKFSLSSVRNKLVPPDVY